MTIRVGVDGLTQGEGLVAAYTTRVLAALSNLRTAWHTIGLKVQEHIAERWTSGYGHLAPLKTSTIYHKAKRFGYYARAPGSGPYLRRTGERAFWWTGDAMRRALGKEAYHAGHRALVMDFGRDSEPRRNLERMHFGGKARPPRPVYDITEVERVAQLWLDRYVSTIVDASDFGVASLRRL